MPYTPYHASWTDLPGTSTPVSKAALEYIETGIATAQTTAENAAGGTAGPGSQGAVVVASVDAPTFVKNYADYVCDGTADEVQINTAIDYASPLNSRNTLMPVGAQQRGAVVLTGGRFNIAAPITMNTAVWLKGSGFGTEVRAVGLGTSSMVTLKSPRAHLCRISDIWFNGNSSSGGSGHIIDFDMTGSSASAGTGDYPGVNADSDHLIHDLLITNAKNASTTRTAIYLHSASTENNRGDIIDRIQIRDMSGNGIDFFAASDSFISNVHMGGIGGNGFNVGSGNTKVSNCKAYYCDGYGFNFTSGRHTATGLESQDNFNGFNVAGSNMTLNSVIVDTTSNIGLNVGASGAVITGLQIFHRASGRYATGTTGLNFGGTFNDTVVLGRVNPTDITNPISGSTGSRCFMRVSNGTTLTSVG